MTPEEIRSLVNKGGKLTLGRAYAALTDLLAALDAANARVADLSSVLADVVEGFWLDGEIAERVNRALGR